MCMRFLALGVAFGLVDAVKSKKYEDTFATQPEDMWFDPSMHTDSIEAYIETWGGQGRGGSGIVYNF